MLCPNFFWFKDTMCFLQRGYPILDLDKVKNTHFLYLSFLVLVLPVLFSRTHVFSFSVRLHPGRSSLVSQNRLSASHMLLCNMKANCLTSGNGVSCSFLLHRLLKKCCTRPRIRPHQSKVKTCKHTLEIST